MKIEKNPRSIPAYAPAVHFTKTTGINSIYTRVPNDKNADCVEISGFPAPKRSPIIARKGAKVLVCYDVTASCACNHKAINSLLL